MTAAAVMIALFFAIGIVVGAVVVVAVPVLRRDVGRVPYDPKVAAAETSTWRSSNVAPGGDEASPHPRRARSFELVTCEYSSPWSAYKAG